MFRGVLMECQLIDVGYSRPWYIWEMGNLLEINIREQLNRGVANEEWLGRFPNAIIQHLLHLFSNYCPLLIQMENRVNGRGKGRFRFEAW